MVACFADSIRTTCMLFLIVMSAFIFSYFVVQTQLPGVLVGWIRAWNVNSVVLIVILIVFYIVMGCFLDGGGMVLITVPIFLPLVVQYGYDPIWFGIMLVCVVELGLIHPPVGMNIFVIQARVPDVPILRIYQGIIPFLFGPMILLAMLIALAATGAMAAEPALRVLEHDRIEKKRPASFRYVNSVLSIQRCRP